MGVVNLCFDTQIGREVAVKVMRGDASSKGKARDRFVREVRIQAQLEHPGVVPVYDLGVTPEGQPYFAMRRLHGITLLQVLGDLREGKAEVAERFPRRKLLNVIERVCETIAYAHARGVVHRDLKPANVMLGDFGEVSVLDWGIAKLRTDADVHEPSTDEDEVPQYTVPGAVVGTAGYMSPEQASGVEVDPRSDIYSLGAILFEVIAGRGLHQGTARERVRATLRGVDARPSEHTDEDVPPELDAICVKATTMLREERYGSTSEMLDDLRAFLDGQRVTELRREVAGRHAEAARISLAAGPSASETVRVQALRELGAAAALDPENREMANMIDDLLEPEDGPLPKKVKQALEEHRRVGASLAAGRSALAYGSGLFMLPLLAWMGVRDWVLFTVLSVALSLNTVGAFVMWRRQSAAGRVSFLTVPYAFMTLGLLSAIFGPFLLVPALAGAAAVAFTVSQRADWRMRGVINTCSALAVLIPGALLALGVAPPSYRFAEGTVQLLPHLTEFPALPTSVFLIAAALFVALVPNILVGRAVEALRQAERRHFLISYRLRAVFPEGDR